MSTRTVTEHTPLETVVEVVSGTYAGRFGRLTRYGEGLCHVRLWCEDHRRWAHTHEREYVGILRKNLRTTTHRAAYERADMVSAVPA